MHYTEYAPIYQCILANYGCIDVWILTNIICDTYSSDVELHDTHTGIVLNVCIPQTLLSKLII